MIMGNHEIFLKAIHEKRIVKAKINSIEKGIIVRNCVPFDFGPSRKFYDKRQRYHFYDLDSPEGVHNLSILPEQLIEIALTDQIFDPNKFVTWQPINWFIKRNWSNKS